MFFLSAGSGNPGEPVLTFQTGFQDNHHGTDSKAAKAHEGAQPRTGRRHAGGGLVISGDSVGTGSGDSPTTLGLTSVCIRLP